MSFSIGYKDSTKCTCSTSPMLISLVFGFYGSSKGSLALEPMISAIALSFLKQSNCGRFSCPQYFKCGCMRQIDFGFKVVTCAGDMSIFIDALEEDDEANQVLILLTSTMFVFVTTLAFDDGTHTIIDKFLWVVWSRLVIWLIRGSWTTCVEGLESLGEMVNSFERESCEEYRGLWHGDEGMEGSCLGHEGKGMLWSWIGKGLLGRMKGMS